MSEDRLETNVKTVDLDFSKQGAYVGGLEEFLDPTDLTIPSDSISKSEDVVEDDVTVDSENDKPAVKEVQEEEVNKSVTKPSKIEEEKDEDDSTKGGGEYRGLLNKLMSKGVLPTFDSIETEDGEVSLDDIDVDEDSLFDIISSQVEQIKEEAANGVVSSVSDFTKHLLEIEKNGGNVSQALETYNNFQDPLDRLDLSEQLDQQKAVFMKYHQLMGMDKEATFDLIESFIAKGKLEDEAIKADSEIRGAVQKQMDALNQEAVARKEELNKKMSAYKTSLNEQLNNFELNSTFKKKIVDLATKENEHGQYELDNLYFNLRNNAESAAELALYLVDREEFIKQVSNKEVREAKLDTMKKLKLVKRGNDSIKLETSSSKPISKSDRFVDLDDIFGKR